MSVIALVGSILNIVVLLYIVVLFGRLILDWIPMFNREWRPRGAMLVIAEIVYTLTDPPIKLLRRFIPPLRTGGVSIDFSFALVMLVCFILLSITRALAYL